MIIYGYRTKVLKNFEDLQIEECKECNSQSHVFTVYQKYAHVFWIPMFPISTKLIYCACSECGNEIEPDKEKKAYYRSLTRTPFYLSLGLIFILCLLAYIMANPYIQKLNDIGRLASPKLGDVYLLKEEMEEEDGEEGYYFTKIVGERQDTLWVIQTYLYYDEPVTGLTPANFFIEDEYYYFVKDELRSLYDEGYIQKVYRKYPKNSLFENTGFRPEDEIIDN